MKKFFAFLTIAVLSIAAASAQETVITKPAALDNNYIGLTVGVDCPTNDLVKDLYPELNLYLGHQFTPVWGIELNGQMSMHRKFESSPTWVAGSYVGIAGTMNLNNLFWGYSGKTLKVEIVPTVGLGWLHTYGNVSNNIVTKMGVDVRICLTNDQAWQLNIRPTIAYNLTGPEQPGYNINYSRTGLEVGVTYHFKNRDGNRNFTQKQVVDYDQYAALNDEINKLRNRKPIVNTVTNTVVVKEQLLPKYNIGFNLNSADVLYTQMPDLVAVANTLKANPNLVAELHGYADAETGTPEYNMNLSEQRVEAVKDVLVGLGASANQIKTYAEGSCTQIYAENDWNRAVVITLR